jgi:polyisoprenoid-binding protein YceI
VKFDSGSGAITGLQENKVPMRAHAFIPVRSLHSEADHLPEVMDGLMQKALKEDQFKRFDFTLTEMTFKPPHAAGTPIALEATGQMAIAGVTNKVTFPVAIDASEAGKIKVSATVPLKMTAYGVTPPEPSFGLGAMRCGDDIKIVFDWALVKRK